MTEQEAIAIALSALCKDGTAIGSGPTYALWKENDMRLGKHRTGWLVVVPLDVPESFEPNSIDVEVYEPDGEVHIPAVL